VFQACGEEHAVLHAGDGSWGNTVFAVFKTVEVGFFLGVQFRQAIGQKFAAVDSYAVQVEGRYGLFAHAELEVREDNDGGLEFFGQVEGFLGDVVAVFNGGSGQHDFFRIAVARGNGVADVALFYFRSHAGGWACTHDIDDDHRDFSHGCHGNGFSHKGEPGAGGGGEGAHPCIAGAHGHHAGGQFVFRLHHGAVDFVNYFNHVFHDFRGRGNGVGSHEAGAGGNGTQSGGFVAQKIELVFLRRSRQMAQFHAVHGSNGGIIAFLKNFLVLGNDFFALLGETVCNEAVEGIFRESQNAGAHAQGRNVFHLQAAVFLCQFRNGKGQHNAAAVGFKLRMEGIVGDDDAPFRYFLAMEINGLLVQGHQAVHMLADGSHFLCGNAKGNGCMAALNAGCKKALAEQGIAFLRQYAAQDLAAGLYALSLLSAHFPNKITFRFHSICLLGDESREM